MRYYLKSRGAWLTYSLALFGLVVFALFGDFPVRLPSLLGGGSEIPLGTLLPVPAVMGLGSGYCCRSRPQEYAIVRRRDGYDLGIAISVLSLSSLGAAIVGMAGDRVELSLWYLRNLLAMCGIVMAFTAVRLAVFGGTAAVVLLVLTTAYGPFSRGARFVRVFQNEAIDPWSWIFATSSMIVGSFLLLFSSWLPIRQPRREDI